MPDSSRRPDRTDRSNWFSRILYLVPFGRYLGDRRRNDDDEGILIGRLKQRARLIGALISDTHRGAILVTGHRGSGKTSLVNHCLEEYEQAVDQRYQNRNVCKQVLWDGVALAAFVLASLLAFALGSQLLEIFCGSDNPEILRIAAIILLSLLILQPFLPAWAAARLAVDYLTRSKKGQARPKWFSNNSRVMKPLGFVLLSMLALALVYVIRVWPPLKLIFNQEFQVVELYLLLILFYLAFSGLADLWIPSARGSRPREPILALLCVISSCGVAIGPSPGWSTISLLGAAVLIQGRFHLLKAKTLALPSKSKEPKESPLFAFPRSAIGAGGLITLVMASRAFFVDPYQNRTSIWISASVLVLWLILALVRSRLKLQVPSLPEPLPNPLPLLTIKALFFLTLGFQLISPFLKSCLDLSLSDDLPTPQIIQDLAQIPARAKDEDLGTWILANLLGIFLLGIWEYETVVRKKEARADRSLQLSGAGTDSEFSTQGRNHHFHRQLFEQSLFYVLFRFWVPILAVPVNLGLDVLDHRRVIEAMLTRLRTEYSRAFCSWTAPVHFVGQFIKLLLTALLALLLARETFVGATSQINIPRSPLPAPDFLDRVPWLLDKQGPAKICDEENFRTSFSAPGATFSCWLGGEPLTRVLYSPIWPDGPYDNPSDLETSLIDFLRSCTTPLKGHPIIFRYYHLLTLSLAWLLVGWVYKRTWPYAKALRRIDLLLLGLSGRTRQEWVASESVLSRLVGVIAGRDLETYVESDPLDPRTVEVATLGLLSDMQELRIELPFLARHHLSLPAPEIIFKFDELDKLGISVIPEHEGTGPESAPSQGLDIEHRRSQALHNLFADMKNLINSGVARFIFIGGRNLHDEWYADLGDRRPLLTNIFTLELHLPSFLTESVDEDSHRIDDKNIRWFIFHLYDECKKTLTQDWPPTLALGLLSSQVQNGFSYSQTVPHEVIFRRNSENKEKRRVHVMAPRRLSPSNGRSEQFFEDLIDFLCYRSRGNPRRLRMLLESFLDQPNRLAGEQIQQYSAEDQRAIKTCEDLLAFREPDRVRIQLIAEVYRRFHLAVGRRFSYSDDKLIVGSLHIADFLLKFHRRAFGWSSLQRVDELVHIYRSPDLPAVLTQLLQAWTGRYLHGIRNGMYDYRFSAEFSQELRYLSRRSEEELAALNFTLDEAQELKSIYRTRYQQLKDENAWEFIAALGELHEFDEEYELARFYYRKATSYLDTRLEKEIKVQGKGSAIYSALIQNKDGLEIVRRRIAWALSRLRVQLQMGMTYERGEDLEQAQAYYRNSRTFASTVVRSLLNAYKEGRDDQIIYPFPADSGRPDFPSTLKHLNLLFQPAFAEAWVTEKLAAGVDTSMRILERSLWELRWILPAVSDEYDAANTTLPYGGLLRIRTQQLNFYLTLAELHNKAGDLLYFKANPHVRPRGEAPDFKVLGDFGGFLGRAQYHYALAIQEVHAFIAYRRDRNLRLQFDGWDDEGQNLPGGSPWPAFVYDATADFLADCGDTLVARVSLRDVLVGPQGIPKELPADIFERQIRDAEGTLVKWLEALPGSEREIKNWFDCFKDAFSELSYGITLSSIFGTRNTVRPFELGGNDLKPITDPSERRWKDHEQILDHYRSLRAPKSDPANGQVEKRRQDRFRDLADGDVQTLLHIDTRLTSRDSLSSYLMLLLMSSGLLEKAGHVEDAARKASRVLETALNYLEMGRSVAAIIERHANAVGVRNDDWRSWRDHFAGSNLESQFFGEVVTFGVAAAERSVSLYQRARHEFQVGDDGFAVGRRFPTQLGVYLCALGLHAQAIPGTGRRLICRIAALLVKMFNPCHKIAVDREPPWLGKLKGVAESQAPGSTPSGEVFTEVLKDILLRNAYPVLGRLCGLKALLDHRALTAFEQGSLGLEERDEAICWLGELIETDDSYDGRLHFTPFYSGTSQALFALACLWRHFPPLERAQQLEDLRRAREALGASVGMYSMKKEFYSSIHKLYYLYDDFNDRRVHFNHGLQMAGAELTKFLIAILEAEIHRLADDIREL